MIVHLEGCMQIKLSLQGFHSGYLSLMAGSNRSTRESCTRWTTACSQGAYSNPSWTSSFTADIGASSSRRFLLDMVTSVIIVNFYSLNVK